LAVACGRLENQMSGLIFPPKANAANERLAQHLWAHRDELFTFPRQPGLDATNWRAELAIRFGVMNSDNYPSPACCLIRRCYCAISGPNAWPADAAVASKARERQPCLPVRRPVLY
jgi:hypothetical protein